MKYIVNFAVVVRGTYAVDADSPASAVAAFRAAGDMRHVFTANSHGHPLVDVEFVLDEAAGQVHYPDGRTEAK